ncbi:MAG TPA: endonuclease/exonuclease/phosphatase family protein [Dissulfurispiraceae bacterium]|nr:endonuclease/exonuclease/phosphatase family protein [Dissulfurispiraceae bacterium]
MRQKRIPLRVATYNVHKCRGLDGRTDVRRIAAVLKSLKADVIALQEVIGPGAKKMGQDEELAMRLNMTPLLAPARLYRGHPYGNVLLSRLPVTNHVTCDLSQKGLEERICQCIDLEVDGHTVQLHNVHFGTSKNERVRQAKKLIEFVLFPQTRRPKIILGDFNEWMKGPATELLSGQLKSLDLIPHLKWRRTYPGIFPMLHLDHLYYTGHIEIRSFQVSRRWPALIASDHLPMVADIRVMVKER